ncbi:glycoside hydrolase family 5 protein [Marinivivus vitaminiproducens]|uniref:glycoside hydrolase family 5 protein n=1 Tax=Marinivivus vitaminiproducens TaxID=3035935 RepID=UPI0027A26EE3|nr:glycoside hydrolase family 5 protein [Geminicoccaceae bacterium SCSIO 64248]
MPTGQTAADFDFTLSTDGNRLVNDDGETVVLNSVNWFGLETANYAPHGLWARGYKDMMDDIVDLGFNSIRLPFSADLFDAKAGAPNGIKFSLNPDLEGKSGLQIMDAIVDYAGEIGLGVVLDYHWLKAGSSNTSDGLWFDGSTKYSHSAWINDWKALANRYLDDPAVIGAELFNEPYGATWGSGAQKNWQWASAQAGNAIHDINPDWLIIVNGIQTYQNDWYWWGGQLKGVADKGVRLDAANKLVYSAHDYPPSLNEQPWYQSPDYPNNLEQIWREHWGYIHEQEIAPIYLSEFGSPMTSERDMQWLDEMQDYLSENDMSWAYWSWNANGFPPGVLESDWTTPNATKVDYLQELMAGTQAPGWTTETSIW